MIQNTLKRAHHCGFTTIAQIRVFLALWQLDRESSAQDIEAITGLSRSLVYGVFKPLADWGLVTFVKKRMVVDGCNVKRIFVSLTPQGRSAAEILTQP